MSIYMKICKRCKKPFDIATNFEICPQCRIELNEKEGEDGKESIE